MKSFIVLLFVSSLASAQSNCLKTSYQNQVISFCDQSQNDRLFFLGCDSNSICFTGDQYELVNQINAFDFTFSDGGLGQAKVINENKIEFFYGDVGSICQKEVSRCQ